MINMLLKTLKYPTPLSFGKVPDLIREGVRLCGSPVRKIHFLFLLFTLLYIIPSNIFSQQAKFKASFGLSLSQIDNDGMSGYHKNGLTAGLATQFPLKKNMLWSIGLKYVNKGSKKIYGEFGPVGGNGKWEIARLQYIDVPLTFTYVYKDRFHITTGPLAGILTGGNIEFTPFTKTPALDVFKRVEAAWILSASYNFTNNWFVQVSTETSYISITKGDNRPHFQRYFGHMNDNILIELVKVFDSK